MLSIFIITVIAKFSFEILIGRILYVLRTTTKDLFSVIKFGPLSSVTVSKVAKHCFAQIRVGPFVFMALFLIFATLSEPTRGLASSDVTNNGPS